MLPVPHKVTTVTVKRSMSLAGGGGGDGVPGGGAVPPYDDGNSDYRLQVDGPGGPAECPPADNHGQDHDGDDSDDSDDDGDGDDDDGDDAAEINTGPPDDDDDPPAANGSNKRKRGLARTPLPEDELSKEQKEAREAMFTRLKSISDFFDRIVYGETRPLAAPAQPTPDATGRRVPEYDTEVPARPVYYLGKKSQDGNWQVAAFETEQAVAAHIAGHHLVDGVFTMFRANAYCSSSSSSTV